MFGLERGRWHNSATRERDRICKRTMRELVVTIIEPGIAQGRRLCAEQEHRAKQERRRHQKFLAQHKAYMNRLISSRDAISAKSSQRLVI
jgi:hypothetical protein